MGRVTAISPRPTGGQHVGLRKAERAMTPRKQRIRPVSSRTETILYPLVLSEVPDDRPMLSEEQLLAIENAGRISLTSEARGKLENIARSWAAHDRTLHSPRPAEFKARLRSIRTHLERACAEADLNREGATPFERHLLHWLMERDTTDLLSQFASLERLIGSLLKVEKLLPADRGAARPRDDHRFIRYLADQFEACGGNARAYLDPYSDEGYHKTAFRQFVHRFYRFLTLETR